MLRSANSTAAAPRGFENAASMKPFLKLAIGACLVLALGLGLLATRRYRSVPVVPDPAEVLTAVKAQDGGTEPDALPVSPVLKNKKVEPEQATFDFGYRIGATTYAYRLGLAFGADTEAGTMALGALRNGADGVDTFPVTRRWSESRHAYLVAASHDFAGSGAPVPNLCIRAVLGPSKAALDLQGASLCVMQRDGDGGCHAATLACGQLR